MLHGFVMRLEQAVQHKGDPRGQYARLHGQRFMQRIFLCLLRLSQRNIGFHQRITPQPEFIGYPEALLIQLPRPAIQISQQSHILVLYSIILAPTKKT